MIKKILYFLLIIMFIFATKVKSSQKADQILQKVDSYRKYTSSFTLNVKISDYKNNKLKDEAEFKGYFVGNEKSLLICTKGKNIGMKVLMKGDNMWVNLMSSKRALRITPMQRLMGQASNGDVAKVSFSQDYSGEILNKQDNLIKLLLKAKRKGATYQRVVLYINRKNYTPVKADFFLLSEKQLKTAYYEKFKIIEGKRVITKIKIQDKIKKDSYTYMEYSNYKKKKTPSKYFNAMYLHNVDVD